jgi:two-component system chemotaxis response regulator CheB
MFSEMMAQEPDIEVVGVAVDPYDAREKIKLLNPDVITLDVEMPKMDGITFLEKIMTLRPMPVIMVSSLTEKGADITLCALEIGAVDYLTKPQEQNKNTLSVMRKELADKIRAASQSRVSSRAIQRIDRDDKPKTLEYRGQAEGKLIAIGSSTGGVEALREVLQALPATLPPIIITQHMPPKFTASFAARLDTLCAPKVIEVQTPQRILPGHVYLAPGDRHLSLHGQAGSWQVQAQEGELVSGHKPSVNVMFRSVAKNAGKAAIGVILTGMGRDGAEGLLAMREAGAPTLGQNEASCVVYGMPKAAMQLGAVEREVPLTQMAQEIIRRLE